MIAQEVNADESEIECLAQNIYHEARSESTAGRMAVALVTINRVNDSRFPDSICGVVKQTKYYPSGNIDLHSCQFSWYCDGKPDTIRDEKCYKDILLIAEVMFTYDTEDFTEGSLWYHSPKVKPKWSMVYNKTVTIDNHIFYKDVD
jgi:spore germination cell wall hydrolase CwlJ-like protein